MLWILSVLKVPIHRLETPSPCRDLPNTKPGLIACLPACLPTNSTTTRTAGGGDSAFEHRVNFSVWVALLQKRSCSWALLVKFQLDLCPTDSPPFSSCSQCNPIGARSSWYPQSILLSLRVRLCYFSICVPKPPTYLVVVLCVSNGSVVLSLGPRS